MLRVFVAVVLWFSRILRSKVRKDRYVHLALEVLEGRAVPAVIAWSGAASSDPTVAANWVGGVVPGAPDTPEFKGTPANNPEYTANTTYAGVQLDAEFAGSVIVDTGATLTTSLLTAVIVDLATSTPLV